MSIENRPNRPTRAAPASYATYTLVAALGTTVLQRVEVTSATLTIGRLPDNALVLPDQAVSRHHAELRFEQGELMLVDVGSASGTFVGSNRLLPNQPAVLDPAMEVHVGPYVLTLEVEHSVIGGLARPTELVASSSSTPIPTVDSDDLPAVVARETYPALLPVEQRSQYMRHLPALFQEFSEAQSLSDDESGSATAGQPSDFLGRMLLIFEAVWEPLEQRQEHIEMYFSPATSPARMLNWMAGWMNLELDPHWPERRRRELLREAMQLYWWRGTRYGLTRMLEVCTGQAVQIVEDTDMPFVFRITVPHSAGVSREFIENLIRAHKPAHVGYVLETSP